MIFSSWEFLVLFLPITWLVFYFSLKVRTYDVTKLIIIASSLIFYSVWNIFYLPIIIISLCINYYVGSRLIISKRKDLLSIGIILNIAPLVAFKYMGWLSSNDWFMSLALPLGISFYTFQQIGYLVDCFSNKVKDNNFINYSSFVTFFPQLIAGPIVHHKELTTQFNKLNVNSINAELVGMGCILFIFGLFKKIVIADNLGPYANVVFDNYDALGLIDAWTGALAYTLQLYYDFSGYCEMAMGLGLFFGIKLPINFFSPYKSKNISVFWRNWHITLGAFFKQYIYIPLGGNRSSMTVNLMVLFIVAFISGIWHGAGLTFVIWGCLHGMALMVHKMWERVGINVGAVIGTMLTFLFVLLAWVPFRSNSVEASFSIWEAMLNFENLGIPKLVENINENTQSALFFGYELLICLGLLISIFFYKNVHEIIKQPTKLNAIKYVCLLALTLGCLGQSNEFLYFDF